MNARLDNAAEIDTSASLPALVTAVAADVVDGDAIVIGTLYERSRASLVDAVTARLECGQRLAEKKALMAHGEWQGWLDAHEGVLGFSEARTAQRLMKAAKANASSTSYLDGPTAVKLSRQMWGNGAHVAANSGNNEWYTPPDILEHARAVLGGLDLDPASSEVANQHVRASRYFTAEDDGLSQTWPVGRIWMNPPYAQPLVGKFCQRFADEVGHGSTGIALANNATETDWFQTLSACASAICFPRGLNWPPFRPDTWA